MKRGQGVANTHPNSNRQTSWFGTEVAQASHRFSDNAKARLVFVRTRLTITTDAQHDQTWVECKQDFRPQSPSLHSTRSKVFNQDIGFSNQFAHNALRFSLAQVECQRTFVARLNLPPNRGSIFDQAPLPQWIASPWRFNFDNIGAKVCQSFGSKWTGNELSQFHYFKACQSAH